MKFLMSEPEATAHRRIEFRDATLKIIDGNAEEITVKFGEGNFQYSEKRNIEYVLDRGNLDDVREGDQVPVEISFEAVWEYIRGAGGSSTPSLDDALKGINEASDWVSSDSDPCRPYAVDLELTVTPTNCSTADEEILTFSDFRYEDIPHDAKAGTISVSGRANVLRPSVVRQAQP